MSIENFNVDEFNNSLYDSKESAYQALKNNNEYPEYGYTNPINNFQTYDSDDETDNNYSTDNDYDDDYESDDDVEQIPISKYDPDNHSKIPFLDIEILFDKLASQNQTLKIYVCGATGSGKSVTSFNLIYKLRNRIKYFFVICPSAAASQYELFIHPTYIFNNNDPEILQQIIERTKEAPVDSCIILDDCLTDKENTTKIKHEFSEIMKAGRHNRLHVLAIGQNAYGPPPDLRSQFNTIILHYLGSNIREIEKIRESYISGMTKKIFAKLYNDIVVANNNNNQNKFPLIIADNKIYSYRSVVPKGYGGSEVKQQKYLGTLTSTLYGMIFNPHRKSKSRKGTYYFKNPNYSRADMENKKSKNKNYLKI